MFKVIMTFTNGGTHTEEHGEDTLVGALQRLTFGPAARMGLLTEVKAVDMLDCIAFRSQWNGKEMKVMYPPNLVRA